MTTDRTTKALLFAIALGVWLHLAGAAGRPVAAAAQTPALDALPQLTALRGIQSDTNRIAAGVQSINNLLATYPPPRR
jgi:hypothetical protein